MICSLAKAVFTPCSDGDTIFTDIMIAVNVSIISPSPYDIADAIAVHDNGVDFYGNRCFFKIIILHFCHQILYMGISTVLTGYSRVALYVQYAYFKTKKRALKNNLNRNKGLYLPYTGVCATTWVKPSFDSHHSANHNKTECHLFEADVLSLLRCWW